MALHTFKDVRRAPDARAADYVRGSHAPIVIDNGSSWCRAGWASDAAPRLIFDNLVW